MQKPALAEQTGYNVHRAHRTFIQILDVLHCQFMYIYVLVLLGLQAMVIAHEEQTTSQID